MRLENIIELAKAEAHKSTVQKSKHGAVVVGERGKVLATGFNRNVISCRGQLSIHAEVDAISKCNPRDLDGAVLFVIRLSPYLEQTTGRLGTSRPCKNCEKYILRRGIKQVFYSNG